MVVALVALATRCVDRDVHRHPVPLADFPREGKREGPPLVGRQLGRERDLVFPRDRRVLARLGLLGGVPQRRPVARPLGRVGRRDDLKRCSMPCLRV